MGIRVAGDDEIGYEWGVRILGYEPVSFTQKGNEHYPQYICEEAVGAEMTRDAADTMAQTFVLKNIERYKRGDK